MIVKGHLLVSCSVETETQVSAEEFLSALPPSLAPPIGKARALDTRAPRHGEQVLDAPFSMEKKFGKDQEDSSTRVASSGSGHRARAVRLAV